MRISFYKLTSREELRDRIYETLDTFRDLFPRDPSATILVKPNLNSNLDALTGNTTDLCLLAVIIQYLKDKSFKKIFIGEGYNSGFHRDRISVIQRNRVDRLAKYYGVGIIDFNYAEGIPITFEGGIKAFVAQQCFDADFFINVPKLKMHYETMMSVCLKSLIGTLVGIQNKRLVHQSLIKNVLHINDNVKPDLHIVDGIIAMEGTGPSAGIPLKMNMVVVGDNAYIVDMLCAKLFSCHYNEVPTIKEAIVSGRITNEMMLFVDSLNVQPYQVKAKRPGPNFIARKIVDPRYQKYFIKVRNAPLIKELISNESVKKVLLRLGLTQEVIVKKERNVSLRLDLQNCSRCMKCRLYCPIGLELPDDIQKKEKTESCIDCLYCYAVCPNDTIHLDGELGYYKEQIRRYGAMIKAIA